MAFWLHSTLGQAELFESEDRARKAQANLVKQLKKKGYKAQEVGEAHFRLTHDSNGFVEAYVDIDGPKPGSDDET